MDLEETLIESVDLVAMEAHKKGLEITIDIAEDIPVLIKNDPSRIRQIIVNLVKNAVKFTKEGSIVVSLRRSEHEGKEAVSFSVIDTGIGVPPELQPRLFTTFFQGDASTTRRFGGTGLGLTISRYLVQLMDGTISMMPNEAGGSIFYFTIPILRSEFQSGQKETIQDSGERLLIVDDRVESRRVISAYLKSFGYTHVEEAVSGEEALQKMVSAAKAGRAYAICIIDMIMPGMDGWRLAAEINGNTSINQAHLILMVPQGSIGADAKMTLLQWFNAYIYKPIKKKELLEALLNTNKEAIDLEPSCEGEGEDCLKGSKHRDIPSLVTDLREEPIDSTVFASKTKSTNGIKILVVEDHPVNQRLFALILDKLGYESVIASDGLEALEAADKDAFQLIFMDIQMPRLNGYETTEKLREAGFAAPIIAVTASAPA
ncbi:hypothetical protein MASR2M78_08140 [Treponema sp.]